MKYIYILLFVFVSLKGFSQTDTAKTKDSTETEIIPMFSISADVLENETESQDISGLLQSSRDVFNSIAGFNLSPARYRIRGYNSDDYTISINGLRMNDVESNWANFSDWGGLNDVTRFQEVGQGTNFCRYYFSGIGGFSNIDVRASKFYKGTRISYANSNRTYRHRTMVTHSTGPMDNGWALTLSASSRYAKQGYVEGTFYNSGSYFASLEKKINEKHSLGFVAWGAPTIQGRQGASTQEAYDLAGSNTYNPYWGYQDGEVRNSRVRNTHKPIMMLNHYFDIDKSTKLNTSLSYTFGKVGNTGMNWYDASDPRPTYYRNLPSYYYNYVTPLTSEDSLRGDALTELWQNDDNTRQFNWDYLYLANSKNLHKVLDADGEEGNDVLGNRAMYIIEEYRVDPKLLNFNTNFQKRMGEKLTLSANLGARIYKSHNFKVLKDLLGADYWLDVDRFAERFSSDPEVAQSDLNNPNNIVKEGDVFGYDYTLNQNDGELMVQAEYTTKRFDFYLAANGAYTSFWRTGHMKNGRFQENSFGDSEKQNFLTYGVKGGVIAKLSGRHYVTANGFYATKPPSMRDSYVSPRTRDYVIGGITPETQYSGDINYHVRYSWIKARLSYYYTEVKNNMKVSTYYHEEYANFVNYNMTGINFLYNGVEAAAEVKLGSFVVSGAFAKSQSIYNSRPTADIYTDNFSQAVDSNKTLYLTGYKVGGSPQMVGSGGIKYNGKKFWFLGVNGNWFGDNYLQINPDRRTEEAMALFVKSDPYWDQYLAQEELPSAYTFDVFAGKSFKIKQYFINVNVNVSNILNNKGIKTGGYEQMRFDAANPSEINKFPPVYNYMFGRTYFAMVALRF